MQVLSCNQSNYIMLLSVYRARFDKICVDVVGKSTTMKILRKTFYFLSPQFPSQTSRILFFLFFLINHQQAFLPSLHAYFFFLINHREVSNSRPFIYWSDYQSVCLTTVLLVSVEEKPVIGLFYL